MKVAIKQRLEGAEGVNHQIYGRRTSQTEGTGRAESRVVGSLNKQQRPACIGHSEQRKELSWKQEKSYKVSQAISSTSAWLHDLSSLLSQTGSSGLETGIGREHKDTKPDVFKLIFFSFLSQCRKPPHFLFFFGITHRGIHFSVTNLQEQIILFPFIFYLHSRIKYIFCYTGKHINYSHFPEFINLFNIQMEKNSNTLTKAHQKNTRFPWNYQKDAKLSS